MQLFNGHADIVSGKPLENDPIVSQSFTIIKQRNNKIWPIDNATVLSGQRRTRSVCACTCHLRVSLSVLAKRFVNGTPCEKVQSAYRIKNCHSTLIINDNEEPDRSVHRPVYFFVDRFIFGDKGVFHESLMACFRCFTNSMKEGIVY